MTPYGRLSDDRLKQPHTDVPTFPETIVIMISTMCMAYIASYDLCETKAKVQQNQLRQ